MALERKMEFIEGFFHDYHSNCSRLISLNKIEEFSNERQDYSEEVYEDYPQNLVNVGIGRTSAESGKGFLPIRYQYINTSKEFERYIGDEYCKRYGYTKGS